MGVFLILIFGDSQFHPMKTSYQVPAQLLSSIVFRLRGGTASRDASSDATNEVLANELRLLMDEQESRGSRPPPLPLNDEEVMMKQRLLEETRQRFTKLSLRKNEKAPPR